MASHSTFMRCLILVFTSLASASTSTANGTLENKNTICWSCPVKSNNVANSQNPSGAMLSGLILTAVLLGSLLLLVAAIMAIQYCRTRWTSNDVKYMRFNTNLNIGATSIERLCEKNPRLV